MRKTQELVIIALGIALVYVATAFINVRLPLVGQGGLIHLGNVPLFIFAMLWGPKVGAVSGGVGMALFDLLSGWTLWAPFTLVIVSAMGYVVGYITKNRTEVKWYFVAVALACVIKVVGYYFAEVTLYGNWTIPFSSVPGNLCQIGVAAVISVPLIKGLRHSLVQNNKRIVLK